MNNNFSLAVSNDNEKGTFPLRNSEAQNAYLTALRHFVRLEEEETGCALNHARNLALRANAVDGESRHWTTLTSADLQAIMPDLTVTRFMALYGDYKSNIASAWNTHPAIVNMVGEHLHALGTESDLYAYGLFVQKHAPANQKAHALKID